MGVIIFIALVVVVPTSVACCYKKRRAAGSNYTTASGTQQGAPPQVGQQVTALWVGPDQQMAVSMQVAPAIGPMGPSYAVYNTTEGSVVIPQGASANYGMSNIHATN